MFSRFLLFFGAAGAGLCAAATGRRGFGARFHAKPCFFVSLAPIPGVFSATGRRGLGARFPAKPCFFVDGHHVFGVKGAAGEPDVVLHSPQNLALSSTGTTSLGLKAPPASRTWCFTPRKTLLFRQRAPHLWDQRRRRRAGRGASLPANPCSFVDGHHVFGTKGAAGEPDVVLHSPQTLALSSTSTTSLGPKAPPASRTWCFTHRKPLLFRRRAPRLWGQRRRRRTGRGASLPAKPCSFVNGHHVFGTKGARPARTWCTIPRKTLFLRFPCTNSSSLFGVRPAQTWCTIPRKTLFLRFLCTKSGCLFGVPPARTWCTIPRKTLFLRFPCTNSRRLFGDRPARIWCTNPRKTLFLRFLCTKSESLFGERPARIWCTIPRKTLFLRFLCTKFERLFDVRPVSSHKKHPPAKGGCLFSHATRFPGRCLVRQPGGAHRFPSSAPTR